jgi:O-acetyl-ADP-ribose deacetylase (regulator of RNase III)
MAALFVATASAEAAAPGPDTAPINVIAVQTSSADSQAEALTRALRTAVRGLPGWSLGDGDYSLEVLTLDMKCSDRPDGACQDRIGAQIKAERYIWALLEKNGPDVQGEINLWVRGKGSSSVPISYSANITEAGDDALVQIVNAAVAKLTGGPPAGALHLKASAPAGQLLIDGRPAGDFTGGEATFLVPIGTHTITVKARGYADGVAQTSVNLGGAPTELQVTLLHLEAPYALDVNWRRVSGFGAIGLGVIAGAVGVAAEVHVSALNQEYNAKPNGLLYQYRLQYPNAQNVCTHVDADAANPANPKLQTLAVASQQACRGATLSGWLQFVSVPLTGAGIMVGVYLLRASVAPTKPTTVFTVDPQFGPGFGKLNVAYTW